MESLDPGRVLDMGLDLRLDRIEFTGRLIGFPLVNGFYFGIVSLFSLFTMFG
jgi:hypothetical protein